MSSTGCLVKRECAVARTHLVHTRRSSHCYSICGLQHKIFERLDYRYVAVAYCGSEESVTLSSMPYFSRTGTASRCIFVHSSTVWGFFCQCCASDVSAIQQGFDFRLERSAAASSRQQISGLAGRIRREFSEEHCRHRQGCGPNVICRRFLGQIRRSL